ncbi:preprotein translocase subunit SecE [Mycoplasmopsis lipofaciens]|uniref:preprotein translocase subunit SecE n=1 Tax=Mycoplasmopsis lipofaciens TaxID=114884 RepID=UPI000480C187|nr:preprotein translocase subunit SecE [Mycoplasmopsis lipofaciens]
MKNKKDKKQKKYLMRRFVKEIKRVRWPSSKKNWTSFFQIIFFALIFTIVVIIFATLVSLIWTKYKI